MFFIVTKTIYWLAQSYTENKSGLKNTAETIGKKRLLNKFEAHEPGAFHRGAQTVELYICSLLGMAVSCPN